VHLDVDVLDEAIFPANEAIFPATDYLMPGGLDFDELGAVLAPIGEDPAMIGLSLGCHSPAKDPGQRCGEALVTLLADVLSGRCPQRSGSPVIDSPPLWRKSEHTPDCTPEAAPVSTSTVSEKFDRRVSLQQRTQRDRGEVIGPDHLQRASPGGPIGVGMASTVTASGPSHPQATPRGPRMGAP
jgi:hypothetical protein